MKGICLVSGGLDSTLTWIRLLDQKHVVIPLFVDYNQWSLEGEREAVSHIGWWLCQKPFKLDVSKTIPVVIETKWGIWIETGRGPRDGETIVYGPQVGSVWGRGIALVGLAAMWAYTHGNDYDFIALGNHKGDVGPDCKPGNFDMDLDRALVGATRGRISLVLPIRELTTEDIGEQLGKVGIPFDMMYSCYWTNPCGYKSPNDTYRCPGCRRKILAMKAAGITDEKLLNFPNGTERSYQSPLAEKVDY